MNVRNMIAISLKNKSILISIVIILLNLDILVSAQPNFRLQNEPDSTWIGQRIIMLRSFGEIKSPDTNSTIQTPNIVVPVARIEGNKIWVLSPGGVEPWVGWTKVK